MYLNEIIGVLPTSPLARHRLLLQYDKESCKAKETFNHHENARI
jgi:hypothetical protein